MAKQKERYPKNWKQIAFQVKEQANWQCRRCGQQCLKPGQDSSHLSFSERRKLTLEVHHDNRIPEDNRPENLVPLCSGCHLHYHYLGQANVAPGQLSLFDIENI